MIGARVSRRSVYENEQKIHDSGIIPQLTNSGDESAKTKLVKVSRSSSADMPVFPVMESGRDVNKKHPILMEERVKQATFYPALNNLNETLQAIYHSTFNLPSQESPNHRPHNFGIVAPGIFRSSLPNNENFEYLQGLGLKTILSLINKNCSPDFLDFMKRNGIIHKVIDMAGTKKVDISEDMMRYIMSIVLDQSNYPILIHCNHGRHRTGCAVAAIRHVSGWDVERILEEYHNFASPKARDNDIKYITDFKVTTFGNMIIHPPKICSRALGTNFKIWRMLFLSVILIILFTTLRCFRGIGLSTR